MTAPDYTELRERLDYTHEHGIFDAQIAGMLASPAEASTAIASLQAENEALRAALASTERFLVDLVEADLDEGAADCITVGMVFQQQARTVYAPRIRAALQPKDQSND